MSNIKRKKVKSSESELLTKNKELKIINKKVSDFMNDLQSVSVSKKGKIRSVISGATIDRVYSCASYMEFLKGFDPDSKTLKEKKVMTKGYFCGNRFCPICSTNQARKEAIRLDICMQWIKDAFGHRFIFLTLTVPNVKADKLSSMIFRMNKAFNALLKYKRVADINLGHVKKVEVTYNNDMKSPSYQTYHPHIHCMMAVPYDYTWSNTQARKARFIDHSEWLSMWQKAMRDPTITQVNVQTADNNAFKEMTKYMAKSSNYTVSNEVFSAFYIALKGKRLITYGGAFKQAIDKYEKGELDGYKNQKRTIVNSLYDSTWETKDYDNFETKLIDVSPEKLSEIEMDLLKRGYILQELVPGAYSLFYIGKTTIGDDVTDD